LGWALLVIAAALIGGLAAAFLVDASLVIAVVVSVVIGAIGVLVLFRAPARSPELTAAYPATMPRAQPPRAAPPPESYPPDPVAPAPSPDGLNRGGAPAVNETVVQLLPLTPPGTAGAADAPWWDSAQPAPAPSAGAKRVPAPDLSTYLASTFIAQCPRCGAFRLDIKRARSAWDFRCEVCGHTWSWQPGTPWPPVRVMPP
jgi:cytoskeletal protein RodZ